MSNEHVNTESMSIAGQQIIVKFCELKQSELKFYPENPRVYSILNMNGADPTQDDIQKLMCGLDHVKELKENIKSNGGLIEPLVVRDGDLTVLEGNSRLAAYRILAQQNPIKWGMVRCKVLPADINQELIFALLFQYHINGKKEWEPFEQAHYLYRQQQISKEPIKSIASRLGIGAKKAEKMVEVIEFMIKNNDLNKRRWSYYEEYLKNASLKKVREENPELDNTIVTSIKTGGIKEAADIRKLGDVAKVNDKQSKKLIQKVAKGDIDLYEAHEEMHDSGKLEDISKKINAFKKLINDDSFESQIRSSNDINALLFDIDKIAKRLQSIHKKVKG